MPLVLIGRIGRPHGLKGELTLDSVSLTSEELLAIQEFTWRDKQGETATLRLSSARPAIPRMLVGFEGYEDRDRAATLTLGELLADSSRLPDPGPGVAYAFQLVGLEVVTEEGRSLGRLADVLPTGATAIYVVQGEREVMIPAIPEFVRRVDLESRTITVRLPAGLEEL